MDTFEKFLKTNAKTALIFEDDIVSCTDGELYQKRISSLAKELKQVVGQWDILYLGHCWTKCEDIICLTDQICTGGQPKCRHAYAVTRKGAEMLLQNTLPMYHAGDAMYKDVQNAGIIKGLLVSPALFYQNRDVMGSHLGNSNPQKECKGIDPSRLVNVYYQ